MFKMGCQFEMNLLLKAPVQKCAATTCRKGGGETIFDLTSFISPQRCRIRGRPELSPNFTAAAFMRYVRMIEISPHKITVTQLLHCHTELSRAVDLIP